MLLEVKHVDFNFGDRQALVDVCLSLQVGGFYALLGPNGAGKSTLFALLNRFYPLQHGSIKLAGKELHSASSDILSNVGMVFQQSALDLDLTIYENLRYHCAIQGMSSKQSEQAIKEQLQRFDLSDHKLRQVRHLNGGHRRRVELARALLHKPSLLLLDEPSVGLDRASRTQLLAYVHLLREEENLTVLWATHILEEVSATDDVIVLSKGRVLAHENAQRLAQRSASAMLADSYADLIGETHA